MRARLPTGLRRCPYDINSRPFLDELANLNPEIQSKLLRVMETREYKPVGGTRTLKTDVRIVAATNRDLSELVQDGSFREDLYYRLNVFPIHIPPLRERTEDIPPLVWNFVRQYESKMGKRIDRIPRKCVDELIQYAWPGNVRELRNLIGRALIHSNSRVLDVHPPVAAHTGTPPRQTLAEAERSHLLSILNQTGWRLSGPRGAAGILGLKRTTLQSKIKKLGIVRPKNA